MIIDAFWANLQISTEFSYFHFLHEHLKSTLSLLNPVADQLFYTEEMYDPDQMFFTEGEQMFYPDEMGYYPGAGEEMFYPEGMDYPEDTDYPEETGNPDEMDYEGDVADPIPMETVDPSRSVPHTYYGDDQDDELSDDYAEGVTYEY